MITSYPDPFASKAEKMSDKYGLCYAKYIEKQWLLSNLMTQRNKEFEENDSYCDDKVNITKFKKILGMADDTLWTGMSWKYVTMVPKFVNVVKNSLKDELFAINAKAIDVQSSEERRKYRNKLKVAMNTRDLQMRLQEITGINMLPEYIPDSDDELNLHMQLKYKQSREIAAEIIINRIEELNNITEINSEIKEDLLRYGVGIAKVVPDDNYGTVVERCNPHSMVYSFDTKSTRNKKGVYYFGQVQTYLPGDIIRMSNGKITMEDLRNFLGNSAYSGAMPQENEEERNINVLYFCFKTTIKDVFKRKRNNLTEKDDNFSLHPKSMSEVISGYRDVWFEGYYVMGTELIFNYSLMRDMVRKNADIMQVLPPFVMYQISTPCLVSQLKVFNDDAQLALLKLRHLVISARPQGYEINIDALQKLDIGGGTELSPIEVLKIYNQTGNLLYSTSSFDAEDDRMQSNLRAIQSTLGSDIGQLISIYNNALNMCYEVTGVNRVRDGSANTSNALLGVAEMALAQSNTATELYLDAMIDINKRLAEVILNRAQQMSLYGESLCDEVMKVFANESDHVREESLSIHKYNFDTVIEMMPNQQEKQNLNINIQNAVQSGQITIDDAIDITSIRNIKLASDYIKIAIAKRQRIAQINQMMAEQARIKAQAEADIAVKQMDIQKTQMELQAKQQEAQIQIQTKQMEIRAQTEADLIILDREYQYKMRLAQIQADANKELNIFKEDAKDRRIDRQSTQQSKMITQRQFNTNPIDFEQTQMPVNPPIQNPQQYQTQEGV